MHRLVDMDFCERQIERLAGFPRYPKTQADGAASPGFTALVECLQGLSANESHCKRIVDAVLDEATACPVPKQLREIAFSVQAPQKPRCAACGGDGWILEYVLMARDAETGRSRIKRRIDFLEYSRLKGQAEMVPAFADLDIASVAKRLGQLRGRQPVPDLGPGVVGTDTLADEFVRSQAIRCNCLRGAA